MRDLPGRLAALTGARRRFALFVAGLFAAAALPPVFFLPGFWLGLALLGWLVITAERSRTAFFDGWWFGFGSGIVGYYWIAHAFLVKPEVHGWLIPFAVGGLAAGLALFPALAAHAAHRFGGGRGARLALLIVALAVTDWLRGHIFTGFPWNLPATQWGISEVTLQPAAWVGVYGYGLLTYIMVLVPLTAIGGGKRDRLIALVSPLLLIALLAGGAVRLAGAPDRLTDPTQGDWQVRLVQPNLSQELKWRRELIGDHFRDLLDLSTIKPAVDGRPMVVIWPETATPFLLSEDERALQAIGTILRPGDLLITGAPSRKNKERSDWTIHNSVHVVDHTGAIIESYDKFHLVPFGEYMPLKHWLPFGKLTAGARDFTPGPGPETLTAPGLPGFSPLVCYEVIFPGNVRAADGPAPGWMLNVTNDGWFGISSGPHQHFMSARFRAVEEGIPLIRVANTGISASVDHYGRINALIPLGERGVIDAPLSGGKKYTTVYVQLRDWPFWISVLLIVCGVVTQGLRHRRENVAT